MNKYHFQITSKYITFVPTIDYWMSGSSLSYSGITTILNSCPADEGLGPAAKRQELEELYELTSLLDTADREKYHRQTLRNVTLEDILCSLCWSQSEVRFSVLIDAHQTRQHTRVDETVESGSIVSDTLEYYIHSRSINLGSILNKIF